MAGLYVLSSSRFDAPIASIGDLHADWLETDKTHIIKVEVPGLTKEDLSLQVLPGNVLQIAGVHSDSISSSGHEAWPHILERPRGSFLRQYKLPENALVHKLEASYDEDGVVTITMPKRKPLLRTIPILVMSKL